MIKNFLLNILHFILLLFLCGCKLTSVTSGDSDAKKRSNALSGSTINLSDGSVAEVRTLTTIKGKYLAQSSNPIELIETFLGLYTKYKTISSTQITKNTKIELSTKIIRSHIEKTHNEILKFKYSVDRIVKINFEYFNLSKTLKDSFKIVDRMYYDYVGIKSLPITRIKTLLQEIEKNLKRYININLFCD